MRVPYGFLFLCKAPVIWEICDGLCVVCYSSFNLNPQAIIKNIIWPSQNVFWKMWCRLKVLNYFNILEYVNCSFGLFWTAVLQHQHLSYLVFYFFCFEMDSLWLNKLDLDFLSCKSLFFKFRKSNNCLCSILCPQVSCLDFFDF